jgi:ABC-type multidrug transport system permease subunit
MVGTKERERFLSVLVVSLRSVVSLGALDSRMARDWWVYVLAALCGAGAGCADVAINDLLFTALVVVAACIVLGILRPQRPWRWVIAVGIFIPITELMAHLVLTVKPSRAQIYESFLAFFPGIAGAYGGAVLRNVMKNLQSGQ